MTHNILQDEFKQIKSTRRDIEQFGFLIGGILVALGAWFAWTGRYEWQPFAAVGALLALGGTFTPSAVRPLQRAWMIFAVVIGWVMTRIILTVLFFLVLTPVALVARLVGKRFLELGFREKPSPKTYWNHRAKTSDARRELERQF